MKKHLLFSFLVLFSAFAVNAQTTVIEAKQVKAVDSLKLKADWITNIIKDSSLSGATVRNFPSTDAVVKYIANRLAHTVKYTDTAAIISGYVRELRFLDSLTAVQTRIQGKLSKSDADTYYPAIQRMIDSLSAVQTRIQDKLTKSDADTYYPAIQRMIDSLAALQNRLQTKEPLLGFTPVPNTRTINGYALTGNITITKSDVSLGNVDNTSDANKPISTATQTALDGKQNTIGYTPENVANKATDFTTVNNTLYPTVQAVVTHTQSALTGVLKDRGNYNASGNVFPSSGGSGSGGSIEQGNMWYISVGGTLGGTTVYAGDWIRALVDAPGQTSSNWAIAGGSFGFTPENSANKSTNTSLGTSNTLYPTQNAVKVYVDAAITNGNIAYGWGNHSGLYPTYNGTGATGTWGVSITGNAATVTNGVYTTTFNGLGDARYLQLTGGTLTGALSGTSATFSGDLAAGTSSLDGFRSHISGSIPLKVTSTSAATSATFGAINLGRLTNTNGDGVGIGFSFLNSSSTAVEYAYIGGLISSNTAGSESGIIAFYNNRSGSGRSEAGRIVPAGRWLFNTNIDDGSSIGQFNGTLKAIAPGNDYATAALKLVNSTGSSTTSMTNVSGSFALSNNGTTDHLVITSTGVAIFSSTGFFGGDVTIGTTTPTLILNGQSFGSVASTVEYLGWSVINKNWKVGVNISGNAGFEFVPSTSIAGTSFGTTPVVSFTETGAITANRRNFYSTSNYIDFDSELGWYFTGGGYLKTAAFQDANQSLTTTSNVTFNQVNANITGSVATLMADGILTGTSKIIRINVGGTYYYFTALPGYSPN